MAYKVLAVDDEEPILELISHHLAKEGFDVISVKTGKDAIKKCLDEYPDLVLLDLILPDIHGLDVAKVLRANDTTKHIPIIMVTAKGDETDVVVGLEVGADDYITKPFSPKVLIARIKATLRKHRMAEEKNTINVGDLVILIKEHEAYWKGKKISLTSTEFKVLTCLARRPNWVFTRYQIVDMVHGEDYAVTERSVDVLIASIRKKLCDAGELIETVRGVGYKLKAKE